MDQAECEGIATAAYRDAGLEDRRPNVVHLARALLGPDAIERGPRPITSPAVLVSRQGRWRIVLAHSLPREEALFAIGHELGHLLLRRYGVVCDDEERAADYVGAALLAPRQDFLAARQAIGDDLPALAKIFSMTQTAAALRLGEVCRIPLAVVAPQTVRVRGPEEWAWPEKATLRAWARQYATPPGLWRVRLTDDPRRVVLGAADAFEVDRTGGW